MKSLPKWIDSGCMVMYVVCLQVMVGAYSASGAGGGRGALLPAPPAPPGKAVIARGPTRNNGAKEPEGPPVTVFIGNTNQRQLLLQNFSYNRNLRILNIILNTLDFGVKISPFMIAFNVTKYVCMYVVHHKLNQNDCNESQYNSFSSPLIAL